MDKSAEGLWRIVTHKPMQDCPLENCGGNVKQYKGCKTPIPLLHMHQSSMWFCNMGNMERLP